LSEFPADAGHQNRLAQGQELLLDGHQRLADAQARYSRNMTGRFPTHLVSVVCDRTEISALSAALMNTARKDWMSLENLHTEMPLTEDFAQPPLPAFAGRVKCRSIYAAAAMDDPSVGIFEMLWERATPLKGHPPAGATGGLTRVQQLVLELRPPGALRWRVQACCDQRCGAAGVSTWVAVVAATVLPQPHPAAIGAQRRAAGPPRPVTAAAHRPWQPRQGQPPGPGHPTRAMRPPARQDLPRCQPRCHDPVQPGGTDHQCRPRH